MAELASAVDAGDWPRALDLAIARWTETRASGDAEMVDRIACHCDAPKPPRDGSLHAWWIELARRPYDAIVATALIDYLPTRLRSDDARWSAIVERWPGSPVVAAVGDNRTVGTSLNWIDRMAALLEWPDDPRVARVLTGWLVSGIACVPSPLYREVYRIIADRVVALRDARSLTTLTIARATEPAQLAGWLTFRHAIVTDTVAALEQIVFDDQAPPEITIPITRIDRLWQQLAHDPADLGARAVLGDALVAAGDTRGELIALQLALRDAPQQREGDPRVRRIRRIAVDDWDRWLGDVAALVVRKDTEFHDGMLEVIRVGTPSTPRAVWAAVRGHRELCAVHTVRPLIVPDHEYAELVTSLPHLRTLEIDTPATVRALRTPLPITRLIYNHKLQPNTLANSPFAAFTYLAEVAPHVSTIELDPSWLQDELVAVVTELPKLFGRLQAIEIARFRTRDVAAIEHLPLVRVR